VRECFMVATFFGALLALVACGASKGGGGGSGSGSGFTTSVNGSASLGSLTSSQQMQLCSDTLSFVGNSVEPAECKEAGFEAAAELASVDASETDSELQSACMSAYNDCLGGIGIDGGVSCSFSNLTPGNCTATVAQFSNCLTDLANAEQQVANGLPSCSEITRAGLVSSADAGAVLTSASCSALEQMCPGAESSSAAGTTLVRATKLRW